MEIILALFSMSCKILDDFIHKIAAGDSAGKYVRTFYVVQTAAIVLIMGVLTGFGLVKPQFDQKNLFYGAIIGVLSFLCYYLLLKSLVFGDGATNITIFRLNFIVSSIIAFIALREALTIQKIIGISLCIITIGIFNDKTSIRHGIDKSILFSTLSCLTLGVLNSVNKLAVNNKVDTNSILFFRYIVVLIIAFAFFGFKDLTYLKERTVFIKQGLVGFLSGGITLLSLYLLYVALRVGDISVISPIIQLSFVFTSVLCLIVLKEKFTLKKIIGMVLAVLSIVIISLK